MKKTFIDWLNSFRGFEPERYPNFVCLCKTTKVGVKKWTLTWKGR